MSPPDMVAYRRTTLARDTHVPASGDLPAYTLRLSDRAKHIRLTVTPRDGLVVVVPRALRGFDPSNALRQRRDWIEDAQGHFAERREALAGGADALLPSTISLSATGEHCPVEYRRTSASVVSARTTHGALLVSGATDDADACIEALKRWLQRAATERLLPLLAQESERIGLAYTRASVRGQRHRWGACSAAGAITLNRCLLFLPPELMRSVLLHELAHIEHPNHSKSFWHLLSTIDTKAAAHRRAIAQAWDAVPPSAEP
jgi:predicted metal-dependent hydrolase